MTGLSFHSGHEYDQIVVVKGVVVEGGGGVVFNCTTLEKSEENSRT